MRTQTQECQPDNYDLNYHLLINHQKTHCRHNEKLHQTAILSKQTTTKIKSNSSCHDTVLHPAAYSKLIKYLFVKSKQIRLCEKCRLLTYCNLSGVARFSYLESYLQSLRLSDGPCFARLFHSRTLVDRRLAWPPKAGVPPAHHNASPDRHNLF